MKKHKQLISILEKIKVCFYVDTTFNIHLKLTGFKQ